MAAGQSGRALVGGIALLCCLAGCTADPKPPKTLIHARFDPDAKVLPTPTDVLRDDEANTLDLDLDDPELTPAERELYGFLNTLDGWLASSEAQVEFTGAIAPASITAGTLQVLQFNGPGGAGPERLTVTPELDRDGKRITIAAPAGGWTRGATIAVAVRGGPRGLVGQRGEPVACDATFYFLRLKRSLTTPPHDRAFPGETRAERLENADKLEELRLELAPYFDAFEQRDLPRDQIAALWTFTISDRTEVEMDADAGKVPLPIDLLIDPDTGKIDIPAREDDTDYEARAKTQLRGVDGFGPTMNPTFAFTARVAPASVTAATVQVFRVPTSAVEEPQRVPATVRLADDRRRVEVDLLSPPLEPRTSYAVVVRPGIVDEQGNPIVAGTIGHFIRAEHALLDAQNNSTVGSLTDEQARQLEPVRAKLAPLLERLGRDQLTVAWPFTTMSIVEPLLDDVLASERLALSPHPQDVTSMSVAAAIADFPLGLVTLDLLRLKRVFSGTITTADYLDPLTRARRADNTHRPAQVPFTLTIPSSAQPDTPLPVVIFAHAIVTERRFVMAVADVLASRGFAVIAIDLPYHGTRTHCAWNGPLCFVDPLGKQGEMLCPEPCPSGSSCSSTDGQCRDPQGQRKEFNTWPVIPFYQASGAAFIDVEDIGGTRDHFRQAVTDLGALARSLRRGNWKQAVGYSFDPARVSFLGQSLGGIIGGTFVALDPQIKRAVLNVPGANLVPMFVDSTYFGPHIDAFLARHAIEKGTADHRRFLNLARWFTDAVDPLNVARHLAKLPLPGKQGPPDRKTLIQMATLDFIIPNASTKALAAVAGVPRKDYVGEHAFLVIPVEPAYLTGSRDAADFLAGN